MSGPDLWGRRRRRVVVAGLLAPALLAPAAPAGGATHCVGLDRPGCVSAAKAFADAADGDRIEIGRLEEARALASDRRIEVLGAGEGRTVLAGGLRLSAPRAVVADLTVDGLELAGTGTRVQVLGRAVLRGAAVLQASAVDGAVETLGSGADVRLQSVLVRGPGGDGDALRACAGTLVARHVTVIGAGASAARSCGGDLRLRNSVLAGAFRSPLEGPVELAYSVHPGSPGGAQVDAAGRLAAGSPLIDAGSPDPLAASEWPEDRDGLPRAADGDGDGTVARDLGAFERPPAPVPLPAGNLLRDPGAEDAGGWAMTGGFRRERYGTFPFPSAATGAALGAGGAFFAGGPDGAGAAAQVVDVSRFAPEIDAGAASASLAALLGGFRADADTASLEARFLGPRGRELGRGLLAGPAAAERAHATTLLPRARTDALPPLTRAVEVTMKAVRATARYSDAYFDNVALTVAPAAPARRRVRRPFAGVRVLTAAPILDRRRRLGIRLGCPHATVGRCKGVVTLTARLRRAARATRVGSAAVALAGARRVHVRVTPRAARAVRRRGRVPMTLFVAVRDGQGVTRLSTVPVTAKRRRGRRATPGARRPAARPPAGSRGSAGTRAAPARPPGAPPAAGARPRS